MKMKTLDYLLEVSKVIATIVANRDIRVRIALTGRKVQATMAVNGSVVNAIIAAKLDIKNLIVGIYTGSQIKRI